MLTIPISIKSKTPMYDQIYSYIKKEICHGNLIKTEKLPSTRTLATHLQVSRNTIDMAYAQLVSEGYVESYPKRGYFVSDITHLPTLSDTTRTNQSCSIKKITQQNDIASPNIQYDFSPFTIDLDHFPFRTWQKLTKLCLTEDKNLFLLGCKQGDLTFRDAIRNYLHQSRGVNCESEQIVIGAGTDYLLQLLCQLFDPSQYIAMENPTYKRAYEIFRGLGYSVSPISLDKDGMNMESLHSSKAEITYVTPSHQYPLGIVMPIKRRLQLLEWAAQSATRYIIEDDHDSEFRYKGKPIPSLQGIDSSGKVIYMGTFSRAIAPAIRIGYMVLPPQLLMQYHNSLSHYSSTVSRIDQKIMTTFLNDGYFERHLNRMRTVYKSKHDTLLSALKPYQSKIHIQGEHAGLHLVLELTTALSEEQIKKKALYHGIKLYFLSDHYITKPVPSKQTLLLGYANVSEEDIKKGIELLFSNVLEN